jgi:hypothetical protein
MTIQRYNLDKKAPGMFPNSHGAWVRTKDHEAEVARLRAAANRVLSQLEHAAHWHDQLNREDIQRYHAAIEQTKKDLRP